MSFKLGSWQYNHVSDSNLSRNPSDPDCFEMYVIYFTNNALHRRSYEQDPLHIWYQELIAYPSRPRAIKGTI